MENLLVDATDSESAAKSAVAMVALLAAQKAESKVEWTVDLSAVSKAELLAVR